ncbi:MAG: class I SAM-dependent RNA methyltransferase [Ectothiorhodospiraceae bacterium]|nr:class I SAM-dependent RNA methyltransferase [Ectothiorhodospiraceae bacterium]MCH8505325.1 hypothetical protein [Ectothiorhodospiraceae bacterium]
MLAEAEPLAALLGCERDCPGCRHRQLTYSESLDRKQHWLAQALAPWRAALKPVIPAPAGHRQHYRSRASLHADWDGAWRFGLLRRDALVWIPDCPVHHPRINRLASFLRRALPGPERFPLAYLVCNGRQATLVLKSAALPRLDWVGDVSPAALDLDGLWLNLHPSAGRRLFAKRGWKLLAGVPASVDDHGLEYGPEAFQQLIPSLHRHSLDMADGFLAPEAGDALLDLYCGLGGGLARWAESGARLLGVELGAEAVRNARLNAPGALVLRGACATRLPQIRDWFGDTLPDSRLLYANPPRTGLEPAILHWLVTEGRPRRLAYLSCSAGTLSRDLQELEAAGYTVSILQPYDFFPGTQHVETLALLRRC